MDCGLGRCLMSLYLPQYLFGPREVIMDILIWIAILYKVVTACCCLLLTWYQFSSEHSMGNPVFNQMMHLEVTVLANTSFKYTQVCGLVDK